MELEQLKTYWNTVSGQQAEAEKRSKEQLAAALRPRVTDAFARVKRSMYIEIAIIVAGFVFIAGVATQNTEPFQQWITGLLLLNMAVALVFQLLLLKRFDNLKKTHHNLRDYLQAVVSTLKRAFRLGMLTNIIITPILAVFGFVYGYSMGREDHQLSVPPGAEWVVYGAVVVVLVASVVLIKPVTRYYIRYFYGTQYDELEACLAEFDSTGEA
jgi:hypothetical protein